MWLGLRSRFTASKQQHALCPTCALAICLQLHQPHHGGAGRMVSPPAARQAAPAMQQVTQYLIGRGLCAQQHSCQCTPLTARRHSTHLPQAELTVRLAEQHHKSPPRPTGASIHLHVCMPATCRLCLRPCDNPGTPVNTGRCSSHVLISRSFAQFSMFCTVATLQAGCYNPGAPVHTG